MSICKKDLHFLIDLVQDKDIKLVYDLIRVVIEKENDEMIEVKADNSPLSYEEIEIIKKANKEIEEGDLIDWDDLNA